MLLHKKIFPALQGMIRRGHLSVPVIGVAKAAGPGRTSRRRRPGASECGSLMGFLRFTVRLVLLDSSLGGTANTHHSVLMRHGRRAGR
jgi:hypothetical protein